MIFAQVNQPFEAYAAGAATGLAGELLIDVYSPATGTAIVPQTAEGIVEVGVGTYKAVLNIGVVGEFVVRWTLPGGATAEEALSVSTILVARVPTTAIRPDAADVGALLRARTRDSSGNELGTFTADTRPTNLEVDQLIDQGNDDVRAELPETVSPQLVERVKSLMALATALRIEISYFPDQVASGRSPFEQYRTLYRDGLRAVAAAVQGNQPGGPTRIHSMPLATTYGIPESSRLLTN
jgi:hypothetical protein